MRVVGAIASVAAVHAAEDFQPIDGALVAAVAMRAMPIGAGFGVRDLVRVGDHRAVFWKIEANAFGSPGPAAIRAVAVAFFKTPKVS